MALDQEGLELSCVTQLLEIMEVWTSMFDEGGGIDASTRAGMLHVWHGKQRRDVVYHVTHVTCQHGCSDLQKILDKLSV